MSSSRKGTSKPNQVISTYNLRPRSRKENVSKSNNVDNMQQLPSDRFIMPSPKRFTEHELNVETEVEFLTPDELELYDLDENVDETSERCPYCHATIPSLMSDKLKSALELMKKGEMPASEFCFIHFAEISVISDGMENNYPLVINFKELPARIRKLKHILLKIIDGTADSYYRDRALKHYKRNGRRSIAPLGLLNRFEELRPGYYGAKGSLVISDVLMKLFSNTDILTSENAAPLKPADYMMEVLIPETAMRLIQEDTGGDVSLEAARKIMVSSSNFGYWVHNDGNV